MLTVHLTRSPKPNYNHKMIELHYSHKSRLTLTHQTSTALERRPRDDLQETPRAPIDVPGNAILLNGVLQAANREIGDPGSPQAYQCHKVGPPVPGVAVYPASRSSV